MCGRYTLTADLKTVAERFATPPPPPELASCAPRYNIAPTQNVIVVGDDGRRFITQMRWGLIPSWAKDPSIGNRMINARAETLAEKPSYKTALRKQRCLIPADGFFEWQKQAGVKQPVRIILKSKEPFGFAGLWDLWLSPEGEAIQSCTIVTVPANQLLQSVHDRMPAILTRESEAVWLDPRIHEPEDLLAVLKPYPSELMEYYPVSPAVNSPAVDKPSNIEPIKGA